MLDEIQYLVKKDPALVFNRIKDMLLFTEDSSGHLTQYIELIKKGHVPVLYSNHQSHADGIFLTVLIAQMIKKIPADVFKGFICPIAASMKSGDQDKAVQGSLEIFYPVVEKMGFNVVSIIREKDREKYGMTGSNREAIERILRIPQEKYGLVVFPEGKVQGGRIKDDGSIHGMQEVTEGGIFMRCLNFWFAQKKESVLLPVGIMGSYLAFNPDNYEISKNILDTLKGEKKAEKIIRINIGAPFTTGQIREDLGSQLDTWNKDHIDYLMRKISVLLPKEARGYYL